MSGEGDQAPEAIKEAHAAPQGAGWAWSAEVRVFIAVILAVAGMALRLQGRGGHAVDEIPSRQPLVLKVDLNTAPPGVIEALPQIGPGLCGRILEQRQVRPFSSAEDLRHRVKGIGPATLARILPYLSIAENTAHFATPIPTDGAPAAAPVSIARASGRTAATAP